ncbi:acetyl-CoA acetyltransferase [Rhodomicrobium udaipurense JA643]|uniref:Acetyl-CoA C-acetyltransferase n=1 Tax=Rhodomicrobium udaipurense TaxID=1202716 RepID=A0A8I1KLH7_9HYPH|nr:acetyl-CoA C-acetyltransferase [Rhodomicrobium udaipurense]KAI94182.1 acetyl-CoA acetyltransferase [Rhodomicrobium udaipurense JA643]MBJ7543403.1 acetyl-CoA C-acetyltransferase [Rhodomicrobium udaipurense]
MVDAYVFDAVRTPRGKGKKDGALHEVTPVKLAAQMLDAVQERNPGLDTRDVEDVILGCVSPVGEQGADIARSASLISGLDETVPGVQVNRFCASGLEAINMAAAKVMSGQSPFIIGGGVESMSRVPMASDGGAWPIDPAVAFSTYFVPQGISADLIATKWGYSRDDVDAYSVESHKRAAQSWAEGRFAKSIVPVKDILGITLLDRDEMIRPDASMQSLGSLKPSFADMGKNYGFDGVALQKYPENERIDHVHTPGNSSGIVDGAAVALIGSKEAGEKAGIKPRARIRSFASIGSEPTIMLTGPSFAAERALAKAGMTKADIDLWELNEAFASVVLRFRDLLDIAPDKLNVNGGAIAMGHPLGATGAMVLGTLLDEMERRGAATGLVTLCIGAGMGTATILELV